MRHAVIIAIVLTGALGCTADPLDPPAPPVQEHVVGLETGVVIARQVRDSVSAYGAVVAAGESPDVSEARTQLAEAEARRQLAAQQVARLENLSQGAVAPRKELEAARAEEASAGAAVARARQVLAAFGSQAARAPLGGDETWVIAQVMQLDVESIAADAAARFTADAFPGRAFDGRVDAVPTYVDPATRTAPTRLRLRDREHVLLPGMTGAATIEVGVPRSALFVPSAAVVYDGPQALVFVEETAGHFAARAVRIGAERAGQVEVLSGVAAGTRVATTGAASLLSAARLPAGAEAGGD